MNVPLRLTPVFAAVALIAGCAPAHTGYSLVEVTELPASAAPTPIVCTLDPESLTLDLQILDPGHVRAVGEGFKPNERVFVSIKATTRHPNGRVNTSTLETEATVDTSGSLVVGHQIEPTEDPTTWEVAVVHSRGVACASLSTD